MLYSATLKRIFRAMYGELPPTPGDDDPSRGLVLVADGVGGIDLCAMSVIYEVARAKLPLEVRLVRWGHGFGRWYKDLARVENHEAQAAALAAQVAGFRRRRPGAPVFLVGKSGGTGIVVRALEDLPADAVEAVVLIASALSPGYDLAPALRAVRREMVVFYSPLDVIILGLGTRLFGTIDRVRRSAAGLTGFRLPGPSAEAGRRAQYAKLRQVGWAPGMARSGYLGGHVGPDNPAFIRKYVLPILRVGDDPAPRSSRARPAPIS